MENRSHALMTGFFTIALLIGTVLAGIWFNRDRVVRVPYLVATSLSVPGLNPQAAVRYRGLEVGKVDDIGFDPKVAGQILVHISVNPDTPVTKSTYATLGYQGVTGIAYVQLDDDASSATLMPSDAEHMARIPLRAGFMDQLESRGKAILAQTEEFSKRANELLGPANQKALASAIEHVSASADQFGKLAHALEPTVAALPALATQTHQTLASFDAFSRDARRLSNNWDQLATNLQAPNGPVARLTSTVERVGDSLGGIASDVELQALPHVVAMTDEARSSLRAVKRTMNNLNERPQSLIFGAPGVAPGPGEAGFHAPTP